MWTVPCSGHSMHAMHLTFISHLAWAEHFRNLIPAESDEGTCQSKPSGVLIVWGQYAITGCPGRHLAPLQGALPPLRGPFRLHVVTFIKPVVCGSAQLVA